MIFEGFENRLHAAVGLVRASFAGRLILRSCHAGTSARRHSANRPDQLPALIRANGAIGRVARATCAEVLDAFEVDRANGFYYKSGSDDFHVPRHGSVHAALAALLLFRLQGARGACAGAQQNRTAMQGKRTAKTGMV